MNRIVIAGLAAVFASPLAGHAQQPPTLVEQKRGNVTDIHVDGQLAATHALDCIDIAQVDARDTPPDLYAAVSRCAAKGDFDAAARLSLVAMVFARFDAARVADVSARDAGQVLSYMLVGSLPQDRRAALAASFKALVHGDVADPTMCVAIARIGPPNYRPSYMILHGMNAITKPGSDDDAFVPGFDAGSTWVRLQHDYLHCA